MDRSTLQRAFRLALEASGVKKAPSIHTLRHSYATHLLEDGVSLKSRFRGNSPLRDDRLSTPVRNAGNADYGSTVDMLAATAKSLSKPESWSARWRSIIFATWR